MSDKYKIWNNENAEDYLFSSARSYAGLDAYLDVVCVGHKPLIDCRSERKRGIPLHLTGQ